MRICNVRRVLTWLLPLTAGCGVTPEPFAIGGHRYPAEGLMQWALPEELHEISGLALNADGRLFAHNDEVAVVYELDYRSGRLLKRFAFGDPPRPGDYEGIAVVDGIVYLVTSNGHLLAAPEPADGEHVEFRLHDTGLGERCEIEGLDVATEPRLLLVVCKRAREKALEDQLAVLAWSLQDLAPAPEHDLVVPWEGADGLRKLHPSGLTRSPVNGNLLVVAARQNALIELSTEGAVTAVVRLGDEQRHPQMEGITITPAGDLIIADEGEEGSGRLSVYAAER